MSVFQKVLGKAREFVHGTPEGGHWQPDVAAQLAAEVRDAKAVFESDALADAERYRLAGHLKKVTDRQERYGVHGGDTVEEQAPDERSSLLRLGFETDFNDDWTEEDEEAHHRYLDGLVHADADDERIVDDSPYAGSNEEAVAKAFTAACEERGLDPSMAHETYDWSRDHEYREAAKEAREGKRSTAVQDARAAVDRSVAQSTDSGEGFDRGSRGSNSSESAGY